MYTQTLYKVIEPIKINTIKRLNKSKKWEYGYNKEHDISLYQKMVKLVKYMKSKIYVLLYLNPKAYVKNIISGLQKIIQKNFKS